MYLIITAVQGRLNAASITQLVMVYGVFALLAGLGIASGLLDERFRSANATGGFAYCCFQVLEAAGVATLVLGGIVVVLYGLSGLLELPWLVLACLASAVYIYRFRVAKRTPRE
jgi:hypothetical protein